MPKIKKPQAPVLAIDLGGTKIITALVSDSNEIVAREYCFTLANEGPESVIERMFAAIDRALAQQNMKISQLGSISIAAAGAIDMAKGIITLSPNLPGWRNIALRDIVEKKFKKKTFLLNDAKAAALGEFKLGAGKGTRNMVYITVSTGIGGGVIVGGRLYFGASGAAGEIGHMTIDVNGPRCTCGNTGCLEMLASGLALARDARRRISQGESSSLSAMVRGKLEDITAEMVHLAARKGDALALASITQIAGYLGVGLVNLVNIFNPEVIIVGGGLAKMGDLLLQPAEKMLKERAFAVSTQAVKIRTVELGDDAGIHGAAIFARQQ